MDKRGNALRRRPSVIVRMAKLKIVGSQHEDDERQRRIDLDALRQALKPVPAWFEWVIPRCTSPIQAIFNDSQLGPEAFNLFSSTPGQRSSKGNLSRVSGMMPQSTNRSKSESDAYKFGRRLVFSGG
jgi:hypothetical protein